MTEPHSFDQRGICVFGDDEVFRAGVARARRAKLVRCAARGGFRATWRARERGEGAKKAKSVLRFVGNNGKRSQRVIRRGLKRSRPSPPFKVTPRVHAPKRLPPSRHAAALVNARISKCKWPDWVPQHEAFMVPRFPSSCYSSSSLRTQISELGGLPSATVGQLRRVGVPTLFCLLAVGDTFHPAARAHGQDIFPRPTETEPDVADG